MSSLVFPSTLKGFDIEVTRTSQFATMVQTSASGKEQRATFWTAPRWTYELTLNFVRQAGFSAKTLTDELAQLAVFFNTMQGAWDCFYFVDPVNGSPVGVLFGSPNGTLKIFQLVDNEGFPATNLQSAPLIYINGALKTQGADYTYVAATGVVTFTAAPGNGAALTWTGSFARVCRFLDDTMDFKRFVNLAWEGGSLKLITLK